MNTIYEFNGDYYEVISETKNDYYCFSLKDKKYLFWNKRGYVANNWIKCDNPDLIKLEAL